MKKKLLALLLALTVTCALAACGEKGSGAETTAGTDGNAGTVKTQQSTEGEVKTADEDPVIFVTRGYNNVENKADNEEIRQAIIEASGINFEYVIVPSENWDDLVNIKIAASEEFLAISTRFQGRKAGRKAECPLSVRTGWRRWGWRRRPRLRSWRPILKR